MRKYFDFKQLFTLDTRSLALMRMAIAMALLYDIVGHFHLINFLYTEEGFLTLKTFMGEMSHPWTYSLLFISDNVYFVWSFVIAYIILLLMMCFGYRTKLSVFLIWICLISFHNRNWAGLNGGDDLVRVVFLLLNFMPLGASFSLDSYFRKKKNKDLTPLPESSSSIWNIAFYLQLSIMYVSSAYFKKSPIWFEEFSALYYALHLDLFIKSPGLLLRQNYALTQFLTAGAFYLELFGAYLYFLSPFFSRLGIFRYLLVAMFVSFHLGIMIVMNVGSFPLYAMAFWLALLPSHFWNLSKIQNLLKNSQEIIKNIFKHQPKIENFLEKHSATFHHQKTTKLRYLKEPLAFFAIINTLFWPLSGLQVAYIKDWSFFRTTNRWLHTYQSWELFAPYPKRNNVWFQMLGTLNDKTVVDLYLKTLDIGAALPEPLEMQRQFSPESMRKVFMRLESEDKYRNLLAQYYCREWNQFQNGFIQGRLDKVEISMYTETNQLNYEKTPLEKRVLIEYVCP